MGDKKANGGPAFEIPDSLRNIAERNIEQARDAYDQFMEMAHKAQGMTSAPADSMGAGVSKVQRKVLDFAQENMDASFEFASQLSQSKDLTEALTLQQKYAQQQMQAYVSQTQAMTKAMTRLGEKAAKK